MRRINLAEDALRYRRLVRAKVAAGSASAQDHGTVSSAEARERLRARLRSLPGGKRR